MRVFLCLIAAVFAAALCGSTTAPDQPYPSRLIRLVVLFAAGGPADFLGRVIGQKLAEVLGQQIVIDNPPGANTIIGAQAVANAGIEPAFSNSPQELAAFVRSQAETRSKVIQAIGLTLDLTILGASAELLTKISASLNAALKC